MRYFNTNIQRQGKDVFIEFGLQIGGGLSAPKLSLTQMFFGSTFRGNVGQSGLFIAQLSLVKIKRRLTCVRCDKK